MNYYVATVLRKGKREELPVYANDKKSAQEYAKIKYPGILIKVVETAEPFEAQLERFKTNFLSFFKKKKIKQDALIASIRQLAVMVNAGISIYDSLNEIAISSDDQVLQTVFSKLAEDINSGHSLSGSMENFRYEVGNLTIAMIDLGEKTGNLDEALYALADMLEEIRANFIKFKKAMAYPRNVMIAMAIAFVILISYVVPEFKKIFEQLHANLPLPTKILLMLEDIFNNYGPQTVGILVLFFLAFRYAVNNSMQFRFRWHELLLKTYLIKNIIMYSTLSRFTLVFSELMRSGIPIADALDTATGMIDNLPLKVRLQAVRMTVEKGGNLNKGLEDTGLFENMILQMVRAGEDSGTLDTMIKKVAEYYKMRFDAIIEGLSEAIEPIMLFIMAAMVLLLALGIFLPMWDMGNAVQGRT